MVEKLVDGQYEISYLLTGGVVTNKFIKFDCRMILKQIRKATANGSWYSSVGFFANKDGEVLIKAGTSANDKIICNFQKWYFDINTQTQ